MKAKFEKPDNWKQMDKSERRELLQEFRSEQKQIRIERRQQNKEESSGGEGGDTSQSSNSGNASAGQTMYQVQFDTKRSGPANQNLRQKMSEQNLSMDWINTSGVAATAINADGLDEDAELAKFVAFVNSGKSRDSSSAQKRADDGGDD